MRAGSSVSVDDYLPPGEAGIPIRAPGDKSAGGIDVKFILWAHPALRQDLKDDFADDLPDTLLGHLFAMLRGNYHRCRPHRFAVFIKQRNLTFRVGAKLWKLAHMAQARHLVKDAMGVINRSRHQLFGFPAGITEHDALIARPLVLIPRSIHAARYVCRLGVHIAFEFNLLPIETLLLIADAANDSAGRFDQ